MTDDLRDKTKDELQDMAEELDLPISGTKSELVERIEAAQAGAEAEDGEEEYAGPTGPTQSPIQEHAGVLALGESAAVEPALLGPVSPEEGHDPIPGGNAVPDGVEDIELGPPVLGGWVQITGGDYAGRFAAYLGDVAVLPDDEPAKVIQVRTRDADNLLLDVLYSDVSSTSYRGGR